MRVCQFALDVDIHNRPEAIVLEGKYWKRQLDAVTAEYKKWRIYHKNKMCGSNILDTDTSIFDLEGMDFTRNYGMPVSLEDGDLTEFMDFTDVLFSSLISQPQPFAFPNPREIARGAGNSDFIQPGLIQLQPNLDDFMDIVEPLQEMLAGRGLATVPEEDFLPEVGETPELPPPTSPLSTPLQYTARVTASTAFLEPTSPTNSPSHKSITQQQLPIYRTTQIPIQQEQQQQIQQQSNQQVVALPSQSPPNVSYQDSLVRSNLLSSQPQQPIHLQQPPTPPQLQKPPTPPLLQQLQQPHTPPQQQSHTPPQQQLQQQSPTSPRLQQHHQAPRSFIRSHSQHDLSTQQQQAVSHHDSNQFVIPKSLPRRRSHSSGSGNSSSGLIGTPSLAPHQVISSVTATTLPQLAPAPSSSVTIQGSGPSLVSTPVIASVQAANSPAGSALLAQLLTSGSYPVTSCQSISGKQFASITSAGQLNNLRSNSMTVDCCNSVKTPLVIPGVITGNGSASSSCNSSNSSICSLSNNNSMKPVVTAALIVPPITLSAVTPSTLKTQSFSQVSPWSPCSPQGIVKHSPPHPEPTSPLMMNVPSPPNKSFRIKSDLERVQYKEHRRVCHINAEQKRRSNLKNNFDIMHQLIPSINQNANAKISKAVMLQKGAEYIHQLKSERQQLTEQAEKLRAQIDVLCCEISNAQALLPATGAPMTHARYSKLKEMFNNYVRERTLANWKFWIFSLITEPLLESYNSSVSTSCLDDLCRSSLAWLDQQCSLNVLRPLVSSSMRKLSTSTNVLSDPDNLPEEVYRRVTKQEGDRFHHR
nr:carbohydrate-responsive element-binding protein-like [Cherax quadricarinatus]